MVADLISAILFCRFVAVEMTSKRNNDKMKKTMRQNEKLCILVNQYFIPLSWVRPFSVLKG